MRLRILSADDIRSAVDMATAIDAMADAFDQLHRGRAEAPVRLSLPGDGGVTLFMPAYLRDSGAMAAKVVSVYPSNRERGLPAIHAVVLALDPETGLVKALMDGTYLTALRTGAVCGLATRLMAREDARVLTVFGAGVQARTQIEAVRAVRAIDEVRVVDQVRARAEELAAELDGVDARVVEGADEALSGADVICAATTSYTPVFDGTRLEPGTHVNAIGSFKPEMQEIDAETVRRARLVVDERAAALEEAGDLIIPLRDGVIGQDHIVGELGELIEGRVAGRTSPDEITFFKSVGVAVQDAAVAHRVLSRAESDGLGVEVDL